MLTFDNNGNILIFSEKEDDKKKKPGKFKQFMKKHGKKIAIGSLIGLGGVGLGALAGVNKDKIKALGGAIKRGAITARERFKSHGANKRYEKATQGALNDKLEDINRKMGILEATGQEGNKEYMQLQEEKRLVNEAKKGNIKAMGYEEKTGSDMYTR